jgi:P4 family phage/plasmid primase-like protien
MTTPQETDKMSALDPYQAWRLYWLNGWRGILPLPYGKKKSPPDGFTGYTGIDPSYADCQSWSEDGRHNLGLRVPDGVVGIDVDHYDGKAGGDTLANLVTRHGALPATWLSTSRSDGISGIRVYRVPPGTILPTKMPGIEFIQPHHRYIVAWPSIHPEGRMYRWINEATGEVCDAPPALEDLPELPARWIEGLKTESKQHAKVDLDNGGAQAVIDAMPTGTPCSHVAAAAAKAKAPGESRHDSYNAALLAVLGAGRRGCPGAPGVVMDLMRSFVADVTGDGSRTKDEALGEWRRSILGAIAIVAVQPQGSACSDDDSWLDEAVSAASGDDSPPAPEDASIDMSGHGMERNMRLARPLSNHLAERFLYGANRFGWLRWDGRRWLRVDEDEVLFSAQLWVGEQVRTLVSMGMDSRTINAIVSYLDLGKLRALVQSARTYPDLRVDPAILDQRHGLLNCANGVVNLRTGELQPHDRTLLFTHITEVEYRADATHPDWDKALQAFGDKAAERWTQIHLGAALTGTPGREDVMALHHGQGANGKTTVLSGCQSAFGEFGGLLNDRILAGTGNEHQTIYMELRGKRLMLLEELPEGHALPVDRVKKLVETPTITARGIGENPTTFTATHSVVISTNYVPTVRETDHGTWRRLVMVDYPHTFTGANKDRTLRHRVRSGKEQQEAVLAWLVEGAKAWYANGCNVTDFPPSIEASIRAWRGESDVLGDFLDMTFEAGEAHDLVLLSQVRAEFNTHQLATGEREWSPKLFTQRLRGHEWMTRVGAHLTPEKVRVPGLSSPARVIYRIKRRVP